MPRLKKENKNRLYISALALIFMVAFLKLFVAITFLNNV